MTFVHAHRHPGRARVGRGHLIPYVRGPGEIEVLEGASSSSRSRPLRFRRDASRGMISGKAAAAHIGWAGGGMRTFVEANAQAVLRIRSNTNRPPARSGAPGKVLSYRGVTLPT